jgi:CRISPR-associated protein Csb1
MSSHGFFRSDQVRIAPGAVKPGGVTMAYALHTWTLSFTQLRRLRFPVGDEGTAGGRDEAARTVLAALALYALALQQEKGYWLRSRCELLPSESAILELVGGVGGTLSFGTANHVKEILREALREAEALGLQWEKTVIRLEPTEKLRMLVRRSDALGPAVEPQGEPVDAGTQS